jgi:hypothetical protein
LGTPRVTKRGVAVVRHMLPDTSCLRYALPGVQHCMDCGSRSRPVQRVWAPNEVQHVGDINLCERCQALRVLTGPPDPLRSWKATKPGGATLWIGSRRFQAVQRQ